MPKNYLSAGTKVWYRSLSGRLVPAKIKQTRTRHKKKYVIEIDHTDTIESFPVARNRILTEAEYALETLRKI